LKQLGGVVLLLLQLFNFDLQLVLSAWPPVVP
jgi:hypothetical protein